MSSWLSTALQPLTVRSGEELPTFTVRCVQIRKKDPTEKNGRHVNKFLAPLDTFVRKAGTLFRSRSGTPSTPDNPVTANTTGPLALVTLLGCLLSIIIFVVSIVWGDGMSMIALILLSSLSTLTGVANKWELKLPKKPDGETPPGDTVIRYPNGSFLVIKCNEEIARELFFAPEEIEYRLSDPASYRYVSLIGTVILMLGIIALANAKLQLQFAWAGAYIIINAAHWLAAAVPQKYHWDLSCYELEEQGVQGGPTSQTFTEALWKAIVLTKDVRWVKNGKAAPQTRVWDYWLEEAQTQSKNAHSVSNTQLMDPMYPHDRPTRAGTVWLLPPRWNPRTAWNELNQDAPRVDAA